MPDVPFVPDVPLVPEVPDVPFVPEVPDVPLVPELCGHALNSRERSGSVYDKKPTTIRSRVSQKEHYHPWMCSLMHNPHSGGYTSC